MQQTASSESGIGHIKASSLFGNEYVFALKRDFKNDSKLLIVHYTNAEMLLEICWCISGMCIQIGICSVTLALCSFISLCLITQSLHKGLLYVGTQLPALWQTKQAHQTMCWTQQLKDAPPYIWSFLGLSLDHIVFCWNHTVQFTI